MQIRSEDRGQNTDGSNVMFKVGNLFLRTQTKQTNLLSNRASWTHPPEAERDVSSSTFLLCPDRRHPARHHGPIPNLRSKSILPQHPIYFFPFLMFQGASRRELVQIRAVSGARRCNRDDLESFSNCCG